MPQKPNRAGNMQNYVPAGNGDASGEYGDNATGSNKHFTNFAKPTNEGGTQVTTNAKQETSVTQEQPPQETPKVEEKPQIQARTNELTKKQIKEIGDYVQDRDLNNPDNLKRIIHTLRYYNGSFGDLSKFTDEELKNICLDLHDAERSADIVWFKEGGKWKGTHNVGLLDRAGIKHYTNEERLAQEKEENQKLVEKSQTPQDKEVQQALGKNAVVCFGKGYSKEDLEQIKKDTDVYVKDFPELKDTIRAMGDRNNLEKYINALATGKEPTEEEIQAKMKQIDITSFISYNKDQLRQRAIESLKSPIKINQSRNAYAYWDTGRKFMVYMGGMKKLETENKEKEYKTNFKSSNKRNATFCHEMGHAVHTSFKDKFNEMIRALKEEQTTFLGKDVNKVNELSNKINRLKDIEDNFSLKLETLRKQNINKDYDDVFDKTFKEDYNMLPNDMNLNYEKRQEYKKAVEQKLFDKGIKKYNLSKYGAENVNEFVAESFSAYYTGMNNELANQVVKEFKDYQKALKEFK